MMASKSARDPRVSPGWWTLILFVVVLGLIAMTVVLFSGTYKSYSIVTLTSDRSGLILEPGAKIKYHGVQVGTVGDIVSQNAQGKSALQLRFSGDQLRVIPANVRAEIKSTTVFGAKYVDLTDPSDPTAQSLRAGATLVSQNVTTEVNTVFQNLTDVLQRIDPSKLNAILTSVGTALRSQGDLLGQTIDDSDVVLRAINPKLPVLQQDFRALAGAGAAYADSAQNIIAVLDNATITSRTLTNQQKDVERALLSTIGLSNRGNEVIGGNQRALVDSVNILRPTTDLLYKYSPTYTCLFEGAKWFLDNGGYQVTGGYDGATVRLDAALLAGDNPYKYPTNLPKVNASGGPGGKPGCGSLPDVANHFPVKQLITDTGYGINPGDIRTSPAIGDPTFVEFLFGVARGVR